MCLSCGCVLNGTGTPDDDHGDPRQITLSGLVAAADANGVSPAEVAATIGATLQVIQPASEDIAKGGEPQRFVLGLAYQAGPDPRIAKGLDGGRDFFTPAELEKAAWSFMLSGQQHGLFHADGTEGAARPVESMIYRNPIPWVAGPDIIVRKGDWLLGSILSDKAWQLHQDGKINGFSPQGVARRRRTRQSLPLAPTPAAPRGRPCCDHHARRRDDRTCRRRLSPR